MIWKINPRKRTRTSGVFILTKDGLKPINIPRTWK